ncbi:MULTISPECIES: hypothetical protein [Pseudomonadaceae]|uniref:Lipoprotein n=1 Tax=Pseudomonas denitrificans TaxID=43306 RepID=A0A9X7R5R4_PSEDE|nr:MULTISPECIES: hypothetical protein [Pseudomonadaceae]MBD9633597.1 hypothetical protein [Pseudomonas sp. PDM19]MBD9686711.1 hypothetical protein [Pseudomonas sp. PDM20]QEY73674.1 hypothetical protein F1C79_19880 [Pseudomonas denitrificans (nom. rej.)]
MFGKRVGFLISLFVLTILAGCGQDVDRKAAVLISSKCAVDVIAGEKRDVVWMKPGVISFSGWAADSNSSTVPAALDILITDLNSNVRTSYKVSGRLDRPDVVKYFNQPTLLKSGFKANIDLSGLAKGTYGVSLQMPVKHGAIICSTKKAVRII